MQGNCNTRPSVDRLGLTGSAPLIDWRPGQCVIVTDMIFFDVQQNLWLDNLYIRHRNTFRTDILTGSIVHCDSEDCLIWMTKVTLQGSGDAHEDPQAIHMFGGQLYADGAVSPYYSKNSFIMALNRCSASCSFLESDAHF